MPRPLPNFWITVVAAGAVAGALYGQVLDDDGSAAVGAVFGICIVTLMTLHERGLVLSSWRESLRRLPAPLYLVTAEATILLLVLIAMVAAGSLCWLVGLGPEALPQAIMPSWPAVVYSLVVCAAFIFVLRMRDLLGAETFANLMLGRYHRPVSEERAFLFLDLVGSTAYAQRHGDLQAQELLKAIFAAIAEPVRRHRGRIDDYIGDQIIVSWPLQHGTAKACCIECVFAIRTELRKDRGRWIQRFGHVPELRAALHGGSVVTAEVGVDRHKIAFFGDVMNATARLEGLCRKIGQGVLISGELLARMPVLPLNVAAEPMGGHHLRGRSGVTKVHALRQVVTGLE
jgi:adenylate cyclase